MGKNSNLDLCLFPSGGADSSLGSSDSGRSKSKESTGTSRQLTIFYNGRVCIFDATEAQCQMSPKNNSNGTFISPTQLPTVVIGISVCLQQNGQNHVAFEGWVGMPNLAYHKARAILCLAKREMEEKLGGVASPDPPSPWEHPQPNSRALSLKRSLQRFLQKRKSRIQGGSPYEQQ